MVCSVARRAHGLLISLSLKLEGKTDRRPLLTSGAFGETMDPAGNESDSNCWLDGTAWDIMEHLKHSADCLTLSSGTLLYDSICTIGYNCHSYMMYCSLQIRVGMENHF